MEGCATLQMKVTTGANLHFPALLSKLTFRLTNTENVPQLYFLHIKLELTQLLLLSSLLITTALTRFGGAFFLEQGTAFSIY